MGLKEAWQEGLVLREARPLPVPLPPHPPQFSCGTERGPLGEKPLCDLETRYMGPQHGSGGAGGSWGLGRRRWCVRVPNGPGQAQSPTMRDRDMRGSR